MRLQLQGVNLSGDAILDEGITDIQVAVIDGRVHVFANTGANGGVSGYVIGANGAMTLSSTVIYPPNLTAGADDRMVLSLDGGGAVLYLGENGQGLFGYALDGSGLGTPQQMTWATVQAAASGGSASASKALILLAEQSPDLFPQGFDGSQVVDLVSLTVNGQDFMITASTGTDQVTAFRIDTGTGQLIATGTMGAPEGLGINAPTAMDVATVNGTSFLIVAASGTSTLSVMRVGADGSLTPVDHVMDNATTRFEGVQDVAVAQSGDHTFVVAGGADNGLTLFLLLPDGSLVHLQTLADTSQTSMFRVTAVSAVVDGDQLRVFVGAQNEGGVTQFTLDLSALGAMQMGTGGVDILRGSGGDDILFAVGQGDTLIGNAGADVLVAGSGQTQMMGGAGADIFVFRTGSGASQVGDFERGQDRLDLSDLPMLRDVSQLTITTTADGARIEYRGQIISVTAADGQPLTADDLFPGGLEGGDRFPYVPPDASIYGIELNGTNRNDDLAGTERNDTLSGGRGNDLIDGLGGDDWIDGGVGNDVIRTGDGNNTARGWFGHDVIVGGAGNDSIDGYAGNDKLYGAGGDDTILSGAGNDKVFAGDGNDVVLASSGRNVILLGLGEDSAEGGIGADRIYGMQGNDTINGGRGNDSLGGGPGADRLDGGDGNDVLFGAVGNDWLSGGEGNDRLWAGDGDDIARGGGGTDLIYGGTGNDILSGEAGDDAIWAGTGNDRLNGGDGNDWISGENGDDTLLGGAGNDTLRGGAGTDRYWGGDGADVFEFFGDHDIGWIMDFDPAEGDILRLDAAMWAALGDLSAQEVVTRFGAMDSAGNVVLDFSELGGAVIIFNGYDGLAELPQSIEFM